ncbi:uncharacterized protein LTR77_000860 [Saxophila tyrrhenica]|uniref:GH16 domain-containing protein n=1 Tax=Saxophila tyrrhenica TaxID=1690608 RepID=A0AAV9PNY6_9PEZI|nr:hypothetical protein LTR77_000860 [Saxophila tyrrhenica]
MRFGTFPDPARQERRNAVLNLDRRSSQLLCGLYDKEKERRSSLGGRPTSSALDQKIKSPVSGARYPVIMSTTVEQQPEVHLVPGEMRYKPRSRTNAHGSTPSPPSGPGELYPTYFHSRRIKKGSVEKPWLENKDPQDKWDTIIPACGLVIGLMIMATLIYLGYTKVTHHEYCPVLMDDFSKGLDGDVWAKEVEVGGYGNGQFEMTTNTDENVFVENGMLVIKPTLQDPELMTTNNVINLTRSGLCTTTGWSNCITSTNTTNGTVVNPVKSGRINTKKSASIQYGKVEVVAKLPIGDWIWPAIWMLPVKDTYGPWPTSGEIDIMESRGNNYSYPEGGNNIVSSTLHWGPDSDNDAWWRNNNKKKALHAAWGDAFHTYGLEWSEKYLFTYIDSTLMQVMYSDFNQPFWQKGHFPEANDNGTTFVDPWSQTARDSTPFDQDFYLVLNVAVGGTNGWFQDAEAGKPWVDASPSAKRDFWLAREQWLPTWKEGGGRMEVRSVKMWQQKGWNGC